MNCWSACNGETTEVSVTSTLTGRSCCAHVWAVLGDGSAQRFESGPRARHLLVVAVEGIRREVRSTRVVESGVTLEDERVGRLTDDLESGRHRSDVGRGGRQQVERLDESKEGVLQQKIELALRPGKQRRTSMGSPSRAASW